MIAQSSKFAKLSRILEVDDIVLDRRLVRACNLSEDRFRTEPIGRFFGFRKTSRAGIMFSVQKFFSHDSKFFDLLEASADETRAMTRLLVDMLKDRSHAHPLHEFAQARLKNKKFTEQISHELVTTFVTGLEREDIEALSYAMYRICKTIEKFAERFNLAPQRLAVVESRAHGTGH
jgi:hypothetical protein